MCGVFACKCHVYFGYYMLILIQMTSEYRESNNACNINAPPAGFN